MTPVSRVFHLERLHGVHDDLVRFFYFWSAHGPFHIVIPENGGLRMDEAEQARLHATGKSQAQTLADTPHGRGAAVDCWPAILNRRGDRCIAIETDAENPATLKKLMRYGELAEEHGLVWGGRFKRWVTRNGKRVQEPWFDASHVEVKNWREVTRIIRIRPGLT